MNIIRDKYGYNAHEHHLKEFLGLDPKKKWPKEGIANTVIQGIDFYVAPLAKGRKIHRAQVKCPQCHLIVAAGRLLQHARVHGPVKMYDANFDTRK